MYNAAVWLREVREHGEQVEIHWRSFPLEQVNNEQDDWKFWEQPVDGPRSLQAFLAAEAVRDQGEKIADKFVFSLLECVHQKKMKVHELDTIKAAAQQVPGLDVDAMLQGMKRPDLRQRIQQDYQDAADNYGVFGTPTLLFSDGEPVFLKMSPPAPSDQAQSLFDSVRALSLDRPYVQEMKKPRRPEPAK